MTVRCAGLSTVLLATCLGTPAVQADAPASDDQPAQVVKVTGQASRSLRDYRQFLPGIREYHRYRHLAPDTELRFGLVTGSFPMKPLALSKASLESGWFWEEPIAVQEDGWFVLPDSPEAERRRAKLVVAQRRGVHASWVLDIHTWSLPAHVYRLGDLRLECRVYLAIEWGIWKGRKVMGRIADLKAPPMDEQCMGGQAVFFNTRPWPRLKSYTLREGARSMRQQLPEGHNGRDSFMLQLTQGGDAPAWSDDALVEFEFYDSSRWTKAVTVVPDAK